MSRTYGPLIIIFLLAWALLIFRLDAPWNGQQARVWVPASVRNFERYSFEEVGLLPTRTGYPVEPDNLERYTSHPPLIVYVPAVTSALLGFNELAMRWGFAAVTLLSTAAMYVIGRRLYGVRVARWATLIYALVPFVSFIGRVPGHDPLGMAAGLLFAAVMINWLRRPNRWRFLALAGCAILAAWSAWLGVFIIGFVGITALFLGDRRHRVGVVGLGVVTLGAIAALLLFYQAQWSGSFEFIVDKFFYRTSDSVLRSGADSFSLFEFFVRITAHVAYLGSPGLIILAMWGVFTMRRKRVDRFAVVFTLGLFVSGLMYQLVFRNASYIHDYYKVSLVPALALSGALAFVYGRQNPRIRRWARPALDGILLFGVVACALFVYVISHVSESIPWIPDVYTAINATVPADEPVVLNFQDAADVPTLEFYTDRPLIGAQNYVAVLDNTPTWYVYCQNLPLVETQLTAPEAHTVLAPGLVQEISEDCRLYYLDDTMGQNDESGG